ncbi:MAG: butyrate kinase [Clostridiales bacterium]|nr:butyrate kinase [Clostridiales bacterium]
MKLFVINPGSTSTKVAVFSNEESEFEKVIRHDPEELKAFPTAASQFEYRSKTIGDIIAQEGIDLKEIDAYAGRGGVMRPLQGGTYAIDEYMLEDLKTSKYGDHASNLGALIAFKLASQFGKKAYIVNPVVVDELMDEARLTGIPEISRKTTFHALNQKAVALRMANENGLVYEDVNFIIAHLGGGISVGAHLKGKIVDVNNALSEGPFTPERAGNIPTLDLVDLCYSGQYTKEQMKKKLVGGGGMVAMTGTSDCRALEDRAKVDEDFRRTVDSMAYKIAREICASAAALNGKVDRIAITGGVAYWPYLVQEIKKRVSFLGPVVVYPGEDELPALAEGVLRVERGIEQVKVYGPKA